MARSRHRPVEHRHRLQEPRGRLVPPGEADIDPLMHRVDGVCGGHVRGRAVLLIMGNLETMHDSDLPTYLDHLITDYLQTHRMHALRRRRGPECQPANSELESRELVSAMGCRAPRVSRGGDPDGHVVHVQISRPGIDRRRVPQLYFYRKCRRRPGRDRVYAMAERRRDTGEFDTINESTGLRLFSLLRLAFFCSGPFLRVVSVPVRIFYNGWAPIAGSRLDRR